MDVISRRRQVDVSWCPLTLDRTGQTPHGPADQGMDIDRLEAIVILPRAIREMIQQVVDQPGFELDVGTDHLQAASRSESTAAASSCMAVTARSTGVRGVREFVREDGQETVLRPGRLDQRRLGLLLGVDVGAGAEPLDDVARVVPPRHASR